MVYTADRRLWLTDDRNEVVEEGSPRAAFLYAVPGQPVPDDEAERYGLTKERASAPPNDKARGKRETKADEHAS